MTLGTLQCLMRYSWPGNNRQLENEVKRLIASVRGKTITEEHLDPSITHPESAAATTATSQEAIFPHCGAGFGRRPPGKPSPTRWKPWNAG